MVCSCHIRAHSVLHLMEYFFQVHQCFLEPVDQNIYVAHLPYAQHHRILVPKIYGHLG